MLSFVQSVSSSVADGYELRFAALERGAHGMTFPCDAQGRVDLDALSDTSRNSYLYARAVVGAVFARPAIQARQSLPPRT